MRKLFLFLMMVVACTWSAFAQNRAVSGTVLDAATNEPLIGATVMPVGGGQGTQTDIDGKFIVNVPASVKKATISYVGYTAKTVDLTNGVTVYLAATSTTLDDVVVIAYGQGTKESLTGSVAVVGQRDIEDRPVTSVTSVLEGNAPGVQVNSTVGQPGSDPTIRIRGFSSINGDNNPIYVVDGVPFSGSIADLNPTDIESMTVLKDASSAALYGNKAANGVILITTKKAKKVGKVDVTLSIRQGLYNRGMSEYSRLGANDWMQTMFNGAVNEGMSQGIYENRGEAIATIRNNFVQSYVLNNIYGVADADLFDADGKLAVTNILPSYSDLDWWKAVSRQGYRQEYNINAAAAAEKFNIFASIGYLKEQGYLLRTDFERFSGRINANFQPTSYFKFGVNLSASSQNSEVGQFYDEGLAINPFLTMFMAPIYPYYAHDLTSGEILTKDGNPVWNTASYLSNRNVAYEMRLNNSNYKNEVIDANVYGTAILPYGFEVTVRGNMNRTNQTSNEYSNKIIGDASPDGALTQNFYHVGYHTFMQNLTWNHQYGANMEHSIDFLLGHENYQYGYEYSMLDKRGQTFDGIYGMSNFEKVQQTGGGKVEDRTESYLSRVRYNFMEKYFGEVSFRRDGSSRFHKDNRWGNFWSAGGSWVISKEKFMRNVDFVNYLKFRAAYGTVGNNASAGTYAYWSLYGMYPYEGANTLYRVSIADPSIKWETTETFDIGLEGTLFNNRLNFNIGYFDKRSRDLLFAVTLPGSAGSMIFSGLNQSVTRNIGTMSNRGWEISFSGDIMRTPDFLWSASIDATFLKNKIVKLPNGKDIKGTLQRKSEGKSIYEYYLFQYAGVDQMTGQAIYDVDLDNKEAWFVNDEFDQARFDEGVADGRLYQINGKWYTTDPANFAHKEWSGTALPTVYGSFGTNLSWKGINLGLLFTYSLGGKTYDSNYVSLMSARNAHGALHEDILNAWNGVPEGMTETSANRINPEGVPEVNFERDLYNNEGSSTRWLISSSHLVFKNINISYDLPAKWVNPLQLQSINLGFSVDNVFTATKRKGMNPGQSFSGGQGASFVTPRVFSFQLTARF